MPPPLKPSQPGNNRANRAVTENIAAIVGIESAAARRRSMGERIADAIAGFAGSTAFVGVHAVAYGLWIAVNLVQIPGIRHFDPFPFMLLSMVVSLEAIFLATFILIKENRMSQQADRRAHLDLQINLLVEREITLVLQLLQQVSGRLGIPPTSEEVRELSEETSVTELANELHRAIEELPS